MRSDNVTKGSERAPNRSLFYALGYTPEELERMENGESEAQDMYARYKDFPEVVALGQEEADGRFLTPEGKTMQSNSRAFYVKHHRDDKQDLDAWVDRQIYIALGNLLLAAGALGVDACPMEGIDVQALDSALGLRDKGLRSVVMVALGYSGDDDFNAKLPKSRLAEAHLFTNL